MTPRPHSLHFKFFDPLPLYFSGTEFEIMTSSTTQSIHAVIIFVLNGLLFVSLHIHVITTIFISIVSGRILIRNFNNCSYIYRIHANAEHTFVYHNLNLMEELSAFMMSVMEVCETS